MSGLIHQSHLIRVILCDPRADGTSTSILYDDFFCGFGPWRSASRDEAAIFQPTMNKIGEPTNFML